MRSTILLEAITAARKRQQRATRDLHAALNTARQAGHSWRELARAAGITKAGARYLVNGDPRKERQEP